MGNRDETEKQRSLVRRWFWRASFTNRYDSSVESKIAEDIMLMDGIIDGKEPRVDYPLAGITKERLINQEYSLGNAFSNSITCLYSSKRPRNFLNGSPVSFDDFSQFNSVQFHHIFPLGYLHNLAKNGDDEFDYDSNKNSIVNIAFLHASQNRYISHQAPKEYLIKMKEQNVDFLEIMKSHLIPDIDKSGIFENDFSKFLDYRASIIVDEIKTLVGDFTPIQEIITGDEEKAVDVMEIRLRNIITTSLYNKDQEFWLNCVPREIREKAEQRMESAIKKTMAIDIGKSRPLDFCEMYDYRIIIGSNWAIFEPLFKSKEELNKHLSQLGDYRNALKHLRPMDEIIRTSGRASLLWFERAMMT